MNLALSKTMTLAEFLDWEDRQEHRHEFDGFHPVAMTGGTAAHSAIQVNLAMALVTRLRGSPGKFYGSDLKIQVDGGIRYPDGFVVCSSVSNKSKVVHDPMVIFEVLSPSTSGTDRIAKNREYQATPSVQRYVILEQDRIAATVFVRAKSDWVVHLLLEDAILLMPEIGIDVPLAEFYDGIKFDMPAAVEESPQFE
jgi:Uma2 family endonuclease